ncbi:hypothetical protein DXT90_18225 [Agrobacterium tumefaciens]|nr:hypothetical protein [Agrobacterium tumefaciens]
MRFAIATEQAVVRSLNQKGIYGEDFSFLRKRCKKLAFFFLRDMYRIEEEQEGKVSATKFAGYWAFWIRKFKPIAFAYLQSHEEYAAKRHLAEIDDINEIIAIDVALNFLAHEGKGHEDGFLHDFIRHDCDKPCDGKTCLLSYSQKYMEYRNAINQKYLISCLSHRTFGPHHLTILFEQLVFGGCRAT